MQSKTLLATLGTGFLLIVGFGLLEYRHNYHTHDITVVQRSTTSTLEGMSATSSFADVVATAPSQGYTQYTNAKYHFSFYYPPTLKVSEYDEGKGAWTTVFQSADESQGFQIFIVPYAGTQVTATRIRMDEPSDVVDDPTTIIIDNTKATMFFGKNPVMGDTREVWFIHGGYLYEVTTYKPLDQWLGHIMATWKFKQTKNTT